jgi:hypothetical protein
MANEFWVDDLVSTVQMPFSDELIATLSDRITKLERKMLSLHLSIITQLKESIANDEPQPANLDFCICAVERNLMTDFKELRSRSLTPVSAPTQFQCIDPSELATEANYPFQMAYSPCLIH